MKLPHIMKECSNNVYIYLYIHIYVSAGVLQLRVQKSTVFMGNDSRSVNKLAIGSQINLKRRKKVPTNSKECRKGAKREMILAKASKRTPCAKALISYAKNTVFAY